MKKFYVSPLFAELELENVLYDSELDNDYNTGNDADEPGWGDFDQEQDFSF